MKLLTLLVGLLLISGTVTAQVALDSVEIRLTKRYIDNMDCVPGLPYSLDVEIASPDLLPGSSVLTPPPSSELFAFDYSDEDQVWSVERECWFSDSPTGIYTLVLVHAGGSEVVALDLDLAAPLGFAFITNPDPGEMGVPLLPTFEWTSVDGFATFLNVEASNSKPFDALIDEEQMPIDATAWTPFVPLFSSAPIDFVVNVYNRTTTNLVVAGISSAFDFIEHHEQSSEMTVETCAGFATDLGSALAGTLGMPHLSSGGSSCVLDAGSALTVNLQNARPDAAAFLVIGVTAVDLPFHGGTLVPAFEPPNGLFIILNTDDEGELTLSSTWPAGVPFGTEIYMQYWIKDPVALSGFSASNALRLDA
jgi:hypothetical protein